MNYDKFKSMDFRTLYTHYRDALLDDVIPFWEKHSIDKEQGGYFTCLNRNGEVYDTDKFIWLQGRQVWMFSTLYNKVEKRQQWLDVALHGAEFMQKHGRDTDGSWYFSLTREGRPLVQPYNIFSDCFATMGFGQLYAATGNEIYSTIAKTTFEKILERRENPKGSYNKIYPGTRPLKNFSLPMILCNLALEIEHLIDEKLVEATVEQVLHEVLDVFYQEDSGLILENVTPEGRFSDSYEGRLLNPGHGIEAMWFVMDLAVRLNRPELVNKAVKIMLNILNYSWDKEYGGIYYFLDIKGNPPQQLEWDQKLWWVHIETLIALIKGYALTKNNECFSWFEKIHYYTWSHFADPKFGEWFGYLNRRGEVLLPLKGGKWKGCFHVPRGLFQIMNVLDKLSTEIHNGS
jgi:N-acylglucosamine 2-epimerase